MLKETVIKQVEKMAVFLAENSEKASIPIFSYEVKKPDKLDECLCTLKNESKIE